ncbi:MAG TPA: DUF5777 family beta-barrel protein [Rhodothermales bacterium]|nr:DUF5777 family beta-barrel protein [Rhodothermales bacterium]
MLCFPRQGFAQDDRTLEALEAQVVEIFSTTCTQAGCHVGPVPQQEMDLTPEHFYQSIVDEPSKEKPDLKRVNPGDPENSYLIHKIEGRSDIEGVQMPLVGDKLSEEQVNTIKAWIHKLSEVDESRKTEQVPEEPYPFLGWKVVNLPTNRTVDQGNFLFLIGHRFNPPLSDGYDALFGLDGSGIILLNLGYAVTDNLFVNLGRSNAADDVELNVKLRLAQQGDWPVSAGVQGTVNWLSEKPPGEPRLRGEALAFTTQVMLTRALSDRAGIALVPGILLHPAPGMDGENPLITLGVGGRWRFTRTLAVVGEWVPILSGYIRTRTFGNENRFDSWAGGLEIATAGHVFQIVLGNSVGIATDQYLRGGDLDLAEGDMRLGFNIFRVLTF